MPQHFSYSLYSMIKPPLITGLFPPSFTSRWTIPYTNGLSGSQVTTAQELFQS
jgi:hypothetical protein